MKVQKFAVIMFVMLALAYVAVCPVSAQNGDPWAKGSHIPVLVNIYPNAGGNASDAKDAINKTNDILKQANIHLHVVGKIKEIGPNDGGANHWGGDNGADGGTAGDGNFTWKWDPINRTWVGEGPNVFSFGDKEIANRTRNENQKGIKISFVKDPWVGEGTPGVAWHNNSNTVVVTFRDSVKNTSETIAHEIGHLMTLGRGHNITAGKKANEHGHAEDENGDTGRKNLMAPSDYRNGTHLTPDQIKEMWDKRAKVKGKCSFQFKANYPATKYKHQFGTTADDRGDQNPNSPIYDIGKVYLTSLYEADSIDAQISVSGILPTDEEINAIYSTGFDIDNDAGTGVTYAGYDGIDRIVYVIATGNIGIGTFAVTGEVEDTHLGTTVSLPEPPGTYTDSLLTDLAGLSAPAGSSFLFSIPKEMLSLSAVEAPVVATAGEDASIYDTAGFVFDSERWLKDPTFTTFGTGVPNPGGNYPFEIAGLEPNDPFDLYLDNTLILSGTLDGSGGFSGDFVFPIDLSNTEIHFLTAQDGTGEFAYSITCPKPPIEFPALTPLGLIALIVILTFLASWTIKRK